MPDWLVSRFTVIVLAVIGGLLSVTASTLQSRGWANPDQARRLSRVAYMFMWASIGLFIYAGFTAA